MREELTTLTDDDLTTYDTNRKVHPPLRTAADRDALREGLAKQTSPRRRKKFVVKARPMGLRSGLDPAKLSDLATDLEIESYQQIAKALDDPSLQTLSPASVGSMAWVLLKRKYNSTQRKNTA